MLGQIVHFGWGESIPSEFCDISRVVLIGWPQGSGSRLGRSDRSAGSSAQDGFGNSRYLITWIPLFRARLRSRQDGPAVLSWTYITYARTYTLASWKINRWNSSRRQFPASRISTTRHSFFLSIYLFTSSSFSLLFSSSPLHPFHPSIPLSSHILHLPSLGNPISNLSDIFQPIATPRRSCRK